MHQDSSTAYADTINDYCNIEQAPAFEPGSLYRCNQRSWTATQIARTWSVSPKGRYGLVQLAWHRSPGSDKNVYKVMLTPQQARSIARSLLRFADQECIS